jgi:ribose transport system substrate-binding protein
MLRLIINIKPDGIIVALPFDPAFDKLLRSLAGIPVVTMENDFPSSGREAYIGTNEFEVGRLAGETAARIIQIGMTSYRGVGILLSQSRLRDAARNARFIQGFRQAQREYGNLDISLIRSYDDPNVAGEDFIREILRDHRNIGIAVCTGAREAEGAAKAVIDRNLASPLIIAVDAPPEIRKLMEMGVVPASIVRNPKEAGRGAVEALVALAKKERTTAYIDPGAEVLLSRDAGNMP